MKNFKQFNESIKDHMTGKPMEDIISKLNKLPLDKQFEVTIKYGLTSMMKDLIDKGVDPTVSYDRAINRAVIDGNLEMVKMLLKDGRVDPSSQLNAPIKNASKKGYLDIVKELLKDDRVDPSANGGYALLWAEKHGHTEILELLKKHIKDNDN